eukprot:2229744-Pleurochrysis_carterae.AAC.2
MPAVSSTQPRHHFGATSTQPLTRSRCVDVCGGRLLCKRLRDEQRQDDRGVGAHFDWRRVHPHLQ